MTETSSRSHLRPLRSQKVRYPPVSLHHQYPSRSVSGWSKSPSPNDMRSQPPTFDQLPAAFVNSASGLQECHSQGVSPSGWPNQELDPYGMELSHPGFLPSPFSEISPSFTELNTPEYFDFPMDHNVFETDFASAADYQHPQAPCHIVPSLHPLDVSMTYKLYSMDHQDNASSPSSAGSSPPMHYLDVSEVKRAPRPRGVSPSSSSSSSTHHAVSSYDAKRRFPCLVPGCNRRFTSQYTLKVHTEAHKPKPRASFPCTMGCNEKFSRQHDRLRHEVAKHAKVCEHSCKECGRFFSNAKTLGNHKCPVALAAPRWVGC